MALYCDRRLRAIPRSIIFDTSPSGVSGSTFTRLLFKDNPPHGNPLSADFVPFLKLLKDFFRYLQLFPADLAKDTGTLR